MSVHELTLLQDLINSTICRQYASISYGIITGRNIETDAEDPADTPLIPVHSLICAYTAIFIPWFLSSPMF